MKNALVMTRSSRRFGHDAKMAEMNQIFDEVIEKRRGSDKGFQLYCTDSQ
jgi:hypothetical protein